MRKALKWIGIGAGGLVVLLLIAIVTVYAVSNSKMSTTYAVDVKPVEVPMDSASIARGRHIAVTRGCSDCHGKDFSGGTIADGPFFVGYLYGPNLTKGKGGRGAGKKDIDWVRSIRYGLDAHGKSLVVMPSDEYYFMSDHDLGALIAYLKTLPPVDKTMPTSTLGPLLRTLYLAGDVQLAAEKINYTASRPTTPPVGETVEYGEYLAYSCIGCHGGGLSGGPIPGAPPDWVPAANLTPAGNLGKWTEQDFMRTLRTGVTPSGHALPPQSMPWPNFGKMTDTELKALFKYLRSVPAKPTGNR
jgi:mono/diheme cytochrome c family protein